MIIQSPDEAFLRTAKLFSAGAAITALFSGSLVRLTPNADLAEVLAVALFVPSLTWVVQLIAAQRWLKNPDRQRYQAALGEVCLLGSIALVPAALANLCMPTPLFWISAANVVACVVVMAADLFRRSAGAKISPWWPLSWCATIGANIALFLWVSRDWWATPPSS